MAQDRVTATNTEAAMQMMIHPFLRRERERLSSSRRNERCTSKHSGPWLTIFNYIKSDIRKKTKAFRLGVVTIIIVVSFITMLKSLVDVAPVALLKLGQDQAGAFDFTISSDYSSKLDAGDVNLYNLTYEDLFKEKPSDDEEEEGDENKQNNSINQFQSSKLEDMGDHA